MRLYVDGGKGRLTGGTPGAEDAELTGGKAPPRPSKADWNEDSSAAAFFAAAAAVSSRTTGLTGMAGLLEAVALPRRLDKELLDGVVNEAEADEELEGKCHGLDLDLFD